jgi:hypothetical protein
MMVAILTEEQREVLVNAKLSDSSYFNPIQDADGNWVISMEEVDQCENPDFMWVKDLPLIEYTPNENNS